MTVQERLLVRVKERVPLSLQVWTMLTPRAEDRCQASELLPLGLSVVLMTAFQAQLKAKQILTWRWGDHTSRLCQAIAVPYDLAPSDSYTLSTSSSAGFP